MAKKSIADRLKKAQKAWDDIEEAPGFDRLPEGEYVATLSSAEVKESQSGNLMISRQHTVNDGSEQDGRIIFDQLMLESPIGKRQVREWFELFEYDMPKLQDIPDLLEELLESEPSVRLSLKHVRDSDSLVNVRVLELLEGSEDEDADEDEDAEDEETEEEVEETDEEDEDEDEDEEDEEDEESDELNARLLEFCATWDIDCSDEDDNETLIEAIKELEYAPKELDPEEKQLLVEIDAEDCIKKPKAAPKKKSKKK